MRRLALHAQQTHYRSHVTHPGAATDDRYLCAERDTNQSRLLPGALRPVPVRSRRQPGGGHQAAYLVSRTEDQVRSYDSSAPTSLGSPAVPWTPATSVSTATSRPATATRRHHLGAQRSRRRVLILTHLLGAGTSRAAVAVDRAALVIDDPNYMAEVVQVIADAGYALLYFDDGSIRRFDLGPLLDQPVFDHGRIVSCSARAHCSDGTAAWDISGTRDEWRCIDLDPLVLYRTLPKSTSLPGVSAAPQRGIRER